MQLNIISIFAKKTAVEIKRVHALCKDNALIELNAITATSVQTRKKQYHTDDAILHTYFLQFTMFLQYKAKIHKT